MTTLNLVVGAGADDGSSRADGLLDSTAYELFVGDYFGSDWDSWCRFTGVSDLASMTIDAANFTLYRRSAGSGSQQRTKVFAEDAAAPAAPVNQGDHAGKVRTTAGVDWDGNLVGGWNASPEIKTVIQELVDSYDPTVIQILHDNDSSGSTSWIEGTSYEGIEAPKLTIDYTEGFVEGAVSLSGVGLLAAVGSLILPASAVITGIGSLTAAGTKGTIRYGAAALSGAGSLAAAAEMTRGGKAFISGVGSVTVVGERGVEAAAALTGVGTLTAIGEKGLLGVAALSGVGSLGAVGVAVRGAAVSLSGAGTLTAVGRRTVPGAAVFTGVGSLSAIGELGGTLEGRADLAGIGSMTVAAVAIYVSEASLNGVGSLDAVAERIVPGAVVLAGIGSLTVVGERGVEASASLSGVGAVTVVGQHILWGAAALAGTGNLSASAIATLVGAASLDGVGTVTVIGETGDVLYTKFGGVLRSIDPADYPDGAQFFFEVTLDAGSGTARARLYNITDAAEVAGSPLTTASPTPVRLRSASLTLPSAAKTYRIEYGGAAGGEYTIYAADVLVESD